MAKHTELNEPFSDERVSAGFDAYDKPWWALDVPWLGTLTSYDKDALVDWLREAAAAVENTFPYQLKERNSWDDQNAATESDRDQ